MCACVSACISQISGLKGRFTVAGCESLRERLGRAGTVSSVPLVPLAGDGALGGEFLLPQAQGLLKVAEQTEPEVPRHARLPLCSAK